MILVYSDWGSRGSFGDGCDAIVLVGMVAHYCVLATYFSAFDHGICPYILEGGIATTDESNVMHVEAICKTVDLDDISTNPQFQG